MARYDRVARLDPPDRDRTFPGWLILRDLDGRDRDGELGRRARLRFLVLRPARRLLDSGFGLEATPWLDRYLDQLRKELEQLPAGDDERARIHDYLRELGTRNPRRVTAATATMGESAHAAGHRFAAEEFYLTSLALAEAHKFDKQRMRTLCALGQLYGERGEWDRGRDRLDAAATLANEVGDVVAWGRALSKRAAQSSRAGSVGEARDLVATLTDRANREEPLRAIAAAARCAVELAAGQTEAALEAGWQAIELLPATDGDRIQVLLDLGATFRVLGLRTAAEACYGVVIGSEPDPAPDMVARIEDALAAAEARDADAFETRQAALRDQLESSDALLAATAHLGLGRGAMLVDHVDDARDHVRQAVTIGRNAGLPDVLDRAEEILSELERRVDREIRASPPRTTDGVRSVAARIESLGRSVITSG